MKISQCLSRKCIWKYCLLNSGHFVHSSDLLTVLFQHGDGHPNIHGIVQGASHSPFLRVPSVLRGSVVSGRVLVLQPLHTLHVGGVWGYASTETDQQCGQDPRHGQQAIHDTGGGSSGCIVHTVRCHYNTVSFLPNLYSRYTIACQWGQSMWVKLGFMFCISHCSAHIFDCDKTAHVCMEGLVQDCSIYSMLTHWGRVTIYASLNWAIIGSDNGLSPVRRQAITWTNAGILLIGPLGTNFSDILIEIQTFSFKKLHLKTSSAKWRLFCLVLNELTVEIPRSCTKPVIYRWVCARNM